MQVNFRANAETGWNIGDRRGVAQKVMHFNPLRPRRLERAEQQVELRGQLEPQVRAWLNRFRAKALRGAQDTAAIDGYQFQSSLVRAELVQPGAHRTANTAAPVVRYQQNCPLRK